MFRRKAPPPAAPWPAQGLAFRFGQALGRLGNAMAQWSRLARASIVLVGMALAVMLFWTSHPGWAIGVGLIALALFWLALPSQE